MSYELWQGDCLRLMDLIDDKSIDLTVTSPPYDNLRTYNDSLVWGEHIWKPIIKELFRVTKEGGVIVWVVADATIKGSETGTSFKQALWFMECGFNLHDTMVWSKQNCSSVGSLDRYENTFEYMFVFSKGKPVSVNIIKDKPNSRAGNLQSGSIRQPDGTVRKTTQYGKRAIAEFGRRHNVWTVFPAKSSSERLHPAPFPIQLATDHIISWSNEGDTILDPFAGSGTTGVAAERCGRSSIMIEQDAGYCKIIEERMSAECSKTRTC